MSDCCETFGNHNLVGIINALRWAGDAVKDFHPGAEERLLSISDRLKNAHTEACGDVGEGIAPSGRGCCDILNDNDVMSAINELQVLADEVKDGSEEAGAKVLDCADRLKQLYIEVCGEPAGGDGTDCCSGEMAGETTSGGCCGTSMIDIINGLRVVADEVKDGNPDASDQLLAFSDQLKCMWSCLSGES